MNVTDLIVFVVNFFLCRFMCTLDEAAVGDEVAVAKVGAVTMQVALVN